MTATRPTVTAAPDDQSAAVRQRAVDSIHRAIRRMLVAIGRDFEHCGKAACARSRRCRGFACEPEPDGAATGTGPAA